MKIMTWSGVVNLAPPFGRKLSKFRPAGLFIKQKRGIILANIGRHFCIDFYGCQSDRLDNRAELAQLVIAAGGQLAGVCSQPLVHDDGNDSLTAVIFLQDHRLTVNSFPRLGYVAIDIFCLGANPSPQKTISTLKSFFRPEKVRTTSVRRGDFGSERDMKPKIRTKAGPIRRIRETGNKMLSAIKKRRTRNRPVPPT
ncbi:MAG: S-adenosylmethionine decarboxylase [Negativicutes bacterium]|nr:S-adenosylmethionine decarboxylase [Negativicutes bacterium]